MGNHDAGASNYQRAIVNGVDNRLFDEVYDGPVFINDKVVLAHEPVELPFVYCLHGHAHSGYQAANGFNCVTELNNYTPINLKKLLESGVLKNTQSIHRVTIDRATERSLDRKNKLAMKL
jgi:calcineurin-like phosphoesterase family protein